MKNLIEFHNFKKNLTNVCILILCWYLNAYYCHTCIAERYFETIPYIIMYVVLKKELTILYYKEFHAMDTNNVNSHTNKTNFTFYKSGKI